MTPAELALREALQAANERADNLQRQVNQLKAGVCGKTGQLHPDCRYWLVMNDMLKAKHRIGRDGR